MDDQLPAFALSNKPKPGVISGSRPMAKGKDIPHREVKKWSEIEVSLVVDHLYFFHCVWIRDAGLPGIHNVNHRWAKHQNRDSRCYLWEDSIISAAEEEEGRQSSQYSRVQMHNHTTDGGLDHKSTIYKFCFSLGAIYNHLYQLSSFPLPSCCIPSNFPGAN